MFAERRPDPNSRRSFLIYLAPLGRQKAELLAPVIERVNNEILADLSKDDRWHFIKLLHRMAGVGKLSDN